MDPPNPDVQLATALNALASPTRLALMRLLRSPKALAEIELRPPDGPAGGRTLARQTVREHLDRLIEEGYVVTREVERPYGSTVEFLLNHQTIFALSEEMRRLARLRPDVEPAMRTQPGGEPGGASATGPCFVLAKGLDEGAFFDLKPPPSGKAEWIVGRRRGVAVALDFDPYISAENTLVTWDGGAHHVEDLPGSRNGTSLNFRPLAKGTRVALRHGDIVGVGRSLLVYWK